MPLTFSYRASLALWKRRYAWRDRKLTYYRNLGVAAYVDKWQRLLNEAKARVELRQRQIAEQDSAAHQDWMPGVTHKPRESAGSHMRGYAHKGLLHTTDGLSDATGTLDSKKAWPNFEVNRNGHITQYMPVGVASRALRHSSSPETNRGGPCQIEIDSLEPMSITPAQRDALKRLMRFIEHNHNVPRRSDVRWGHNGAHRLSGSQWINVTGWVGHEHVPENDHTDPSGPGTIDINDLLS